MYKFIKITPATGKHKYKAIFMDLKTNREKTVSFGAKGYNDYLIYNKITTKEEADKHRERYIKRHAGDNLKDPISPGSLSMHLLWGEHKTLNENLKDYLKRFKNEIQ
jgi:hypothetical protein